MANTLLVRYHSLGDCIIVLPLLIALAEKYPEDRFTLMIHPLFLSLEETMPPNVNFIPAFERKREGFLRGITNFLRKRRFLRHIPALLEPFDKVVLLQNGKIEQRMADHLARKRGDVLWARTDEEAFLCEERLLGGCNDGLTIVGQHKKALGEVGYTDLGYSLNPGPIRRKDMSDVEKRLGIHPGKKLIAISPFSKEESKIYLLERMEKVISHFSRCGNYQILLLGGGEQEREVTERWAGNYPCVISLIGKLPFGDEIALQARCSLALAMDSVNLHLAAFLEIPTVSVWGSTLPRNGFCPPNVPAGNCVAKNLPCQPCSLFGRTVCGNAALFDCLDIAPESLVAKMEEVLTRAA